VPRPTKQEIDDEIVDRAAALFARHGFKETSVQRIADAVGYSKTGLLHRFPTKEVLQDAVMHRFAAEIRSIAADVREVPPGPARDHEVIGAIVDLALRRPGFIALILSVFSVENEHIDDHMPLKNIAEGLFEAFAVDLECDHLRVVRVTGALGALAVTSLAFRDHPSAERRDQIVAISYDALGHARSEAN
jgi:AcrR family transcriptional regulator